MYKWIDELLWTLIKWSYRNGHERTENFLEDIQLFLFEYHYKVGRFMPKKEREDFEAHCKQLEKGE